MTKTIIIAEAGVNHNGDINKAKALIDKAKEAGADYVKFQTFITELNISKKSPKASYQKLQTGNEETQYEMVKKLELSFDDFTILEHYCKTVGIAFMSTGFDYPSIDFLDNFNPQFFKIPSGELTNKPYLEYVASKNRDIILSTGMATIQEIENAIHIFEKFGINRKRITVLHCNTEYPTPMDDVNLLAMNHIGRELNMNIGYSDHTIGIEVPIAAVALGATVIEKHFTLDRKLPGPDHAASLEPGELKAMINAIRNIEKALGGSGIKSPSFSEQKNIAIARKSIHVNKALTKGTLIKQEDLVMLRPGDGISPMNIDKILGRRLIKDVPENHKLNNDDLA